MSSNSSAYHPHDHTINSMNRHFIKRKKVQFANLRNEKRSEYHRHTLTAAVASASAAAATTTTIPAAEINSFDLTKIFINHCCAQQRNDEMMKKVMGRRKVERCHIIVIILLLTNLKLYFGLDRKN